MNANKEGWVEEGEIIYKPAKMIASWRLGVIVLIMVLAHELLEDKTFKPSKV